MLKFLGIISVLGGAAGFLYNWICVERENQKKLEAMIFFLQKSLYVMQKEKIKVIDYLKRYIERDVSHQMNKNVVLGNVLEEIVVRLSSNTYANGYIVWEDVFREEERNWNFDDEVFHIMVQAGNGFFGHSREENICFLQKSIRELEQQQSRIKEKGKQERKVWIPVGMLSAVMLVIFFL